MYINIKKVKLNQYLNFIVALLSDLPVRYYHLNSVYFLEYAICFPLLTWLDQENLELRVRLGNDGVCPAQANMFLEQNLLLYINLK